MSWWRRRKPGDESRPEEMSGADYPLIRHEHISRVFKGGDEDTMALNDITVDIHSGEYVSVSGPSGCGKSTLLSVLALLDSPTSGRYWLNGRATDRLKSSERAQLRNLEVGLIFQNFNLIGDMTVHENVSADTSRCARRRAQRARRRGVAARRTDLTSKTAARITFRRPSAAGRRRARNYRQARHFASG